jgi:glycosyltransferase involved in cell wall biosynthesis
MVVGQWLSFGIGGADKASYLLTKGLIELGVEVKIFYNELSFPTLSVQLDADAKIVSRYEQCKNLGVPMFKIDDPKQLNNYGLTVLNTHRGGDDFWLIPGFEDGSFNFKIVETNFHGHTGTRADIRIFPSYEMLRDKSITCSHKVIPNPIMCKLTDDNLKQQLGIEDRFVFGRIGRPAIDIYSNTCLKAFRVIENDAVYFLYVAPCNAAVRDIKSLKIENIIVIDQTLDELYISKLYNTFDVLCHSNKMGETFGNTIAEAMSHGTPVVSHVGSKWPQAQKEVIGKYEGLYVCKNDPERYSELMSKLFLDKQEYNAYSKYVKARAEKLYDYRVVAKKYIEVYKGL